MARKSERIRALFFLLLRHISPTGANDSVHRLAALFGQSSVVRCNDGLALNLLNTLTPIACCAKSAKIFITCFSTARKWNDVIDMQAQTMLKGR